MSSSVRNRSWLWAACCLNLWAILFGFPCTSVCEPKPAPDDFLIKPLDTEGSLPGSTVTAITQTPDGYLWIGTYEGLTRFDGVHSVTFDSLNTPALSHSRIQGLYLDARG